MFYKWNVMMEFGIYIYVLQVIHFNGACVLTQNIICSNYLLTVGRRLIKHQIVMYDTNSKCHMILFLNK